MARAIDEVELTRWMHAHLSVVAVPVADVDTLEALESEILTEVDPPLNLAQVSKTPLRTQLSALRKRYAGGELGMHARGHREVSTVEEVPGRPKSRVASSVRPKIPLGVTPRRQQEEIRANHPDRL
ncbi:GIY-YIG nuclease family protein [Ornithinimicrobium sp. Y1847]|uniref:GIY-YIG nuclease family protein n=1 Tax=Ornithinimicrobium sp. Y1847 TaxID=3405419 RepID=UPI003B66C54F